VLIARRGPHKSLGGKWEFPGGKIEETENPVEALVREMGEEFDMQLNVREHYITVNHSYPTFDIELTGFLADYISGTSTSTDHDIVEWVDVKDLFSFDLAEADIPIAKKLVEQ